MIDISNITIGTTFRYRLRKYHVVNSFYDRGTLYYVARYYGKYKQWWFYEVFADWEIEAGISNGLITKFKAMKGE